MQARAGFQRTSTNTPVGRRTLPSPTECCAAPGRPYTRGMTLRCLSILITRGALLGVISAVSFVASCTSSGDASTGSHVGSGAGTGGPLPPAASCKPASAGSTTIQKPTLLLTLKDRWHESWLGSPAVADLDGDGKNEIIVARDDRLVV